LRVRIVVSLDGQIETEVELTKPVTVVGRHPGCDVCIDHPAVSGRHMLFRIVNRTVYVEDLASTNGTKLNGHAVQHQVVHHLDLVEVGKHRLHFFDDELLAAGGVSNLETTIHTDFEKTMMVGHAAAQQEAAAPPVLTQEAPRRARDDLSRTMAIPAMRREADSLLEPATHAGALAVRMLTGIHAGEVMSLERANTMLGNAGSDTALVVRRGEGYFLARFAGAAPRLNRKDLEPGAHRIAPRDLIEVGNARYEVIAVKP
jgi:hypothetical protein